MNKAFALPVIHSGNGSLEQYIHTVNSIPMLTAEEETQLAERQQKGDLNAAKQLILSHLRVVVSIARGYDGYGLNQADLIQEGNIGLMKAVKRYEPSRGARYFRLPCIGLSRNPRIHFAQLAFGPRCHHQTATQTVLQSAQHA